MKDFKIRKRDVVKGAGLVGNILGATALQEIIFSLGESAKPEPNTFDLIRLLSAAVWFPWLVGCGGAALWFQTVDEICGSIEKELSK